MLHRAFHHVLLAVLLSTFGSAAFRTCTAQEGTLAKPQAIAVTAEPLAKVPDAIFRYVNRPESVYSWELKDTQKTPAGTVYTLELTSQTWQSIVWKHVLQIYEPVEIKHNNHVLLFVTGGAIGKQPREGDIQRGLALSKLSAARTATLFQVPNQPLLGDHVEDDLITETWLKYLETGDDTWPLLFPMVKSASKAMDAIQEFAKQQCATDVEGFVITGASKRGWTSWLTPVVDKRVIATAPIVIDTLNFRAQMKHQIDTWGAYSEQINDYTSKGLIIEGEENERERMLRTMMDPFTYRNQLTLPKLLVNGTNDPYWVCDAMRWYWDDLQGPKYILQVPNAGHGLEGGQEYALSTIAAYFQHAAGGTAPPALTWKNTIAGDSIELAVNTSETPLSAHHWTAKSTDKDFRDERWESTELQSDGQVYVGRSTKPESGFMAEYIELKYELNGVPYSLCTQIYRH